MALQLESGVLEKRFDQFRIVVDILCGFDGRRCQVFRVFADKVGKVRTLHDAPARFDRIQLRSIGRQRNEFKPVGMTLLEEFLRRFVTAEVVPNKNDLLSVMKMQLRQPENKVFRENAAGIDRKKKTKSAQSRRDDDPADRRMMKTSGRLGQDRRFADLRPRFANVRKEIETALVLENQGDVVFDALFFS